MPLNNDLLDEKKLNAVLQYPESKIKISVSDIDSDDTKEHRIVFLFKPKAQKGKATPPLSEYEYFKGSNGELVEAPGIWYVGLGSLSDLEGDNLASTFVKVLRKAVFALKSASLILPAELDEKISVTQAANYLATSLGVVSYPVDFLKAKASSKNVKLASLKVIVKKDKTKWKRELTKYYEMSKHINGMRQVQALPGNYLTAVTAEKRARQIAKKYELKIKVLKQADLEKLGAGGILAVNKGSAREPRMIVLEYNPPSQGKKKVKTFAIVGKGVTFDTGGISLKPGAEMHEMKYDMSGAGCALHAIAAIAELKLPVRVICTVGMVENMPGSAAFKPGDVLTTLKGVTVEVQNTDAEGRLVLADLLHYTEKHYKPDLMVDLATLTGAILVALAQYYAGLFTPDKGVRASLEKAAEQSLEPLWAMPVGKKFKEMLKSDIADYNNIGGRFGGSSSAAAFLSIFVDKPERWAHLDIAGVGFVKKPFNVYPAVATGYGVRLLAQIAENL